MISSWGRNVVTVFIRENSFPTRTQTQENEAGCLSLTPVTLPMQEAEIRRIEVQSQLQANSL
jgi:hypothetical protein